VASRRVERVHDTGEVLDQQRCRPSFARAVNAADSALEPADASIAIGPRQAELGVLGSDRLAGAANRGRLSALLREVGQIVRQRGDGRWERRFVARDAPAFELLPVAGVRLARAGSERVLEVVPSRGMARDCGRGRRGGDKLQRCG
jgi:hypothetical protein